MCWLTRRLDINQKEASTRRRHQPEEGYLPHGAYQACGGGAVVHDTTSTVSTHHKVQELEPKDHR